MKKWPFVLIGGGVAALIAAYFANRKSNQVTASIADAVTGAGPGPQPDDVVTLPAVPPGGSQVKIRTTGYWPFVAGLSGAALKMEGGTNDRKGKPLYTLEMYQADPVKAPYVSVSGDPTIWPYGQRIALDFWPGIPFRVVDTGSHFTGAGKVYRMAGYEPLDICVNSSTTKVPLTATATVFPGDNFAKGAAVAMGKFKGQTVAGDTILGGDTIARTRVAAEIIDRYNSLEIRP